MGIGTKASSEHPKAITIVIATVNQKFGYARHRVPKANDHEDICVRVAALLAKERQRKGLSMTQLATGAGLSQPSVSYLERNLRNPNLTTLLRISDALGLNLGKLIQQAVKDIRTTGS